MDWIDTRQGRGHQRMAHMVIGDAKPLLWAEHAAPLLEAGDDTFDCKREIIERHRVAVAPSRYDGGLINKVGKVGASKAGRQPSDLVEINVRGKLHLGDVHLEDFQSSCAVRAVDDRLAVETSGP